MLDLKAIRQNPDKFKETLARKNIKSKQIDELLAADQKQRELQQQTELLKAEQNQMSKKIAQLEGEEKQAALTAMKQVATKRKELEPQLQLATETVKKLLFALPNPPYAEVPDGGEDDGKIIKTWGEKPDFDFKPKEHWEIAENLNILDTKRSAKVSGSRFYYLRDELAVLQMALMNWAFLEIQKLGFSPTIPPFMTKKEAIVGTGFFDKEENYCVNPGEDDLYLIGTSEVPLSSFHADEILDEASLPRLFAGYSPCFRREAGSYGKDTKGILRVHQFEKIEMVAFCTPEQSEAMHERMREAEENILQQLGIPYQVVLIAANDLGNSAAKKYDLEAWLPGQGRYREMTSTSICTDFQARRLKIRIRRQDGSVEIAHTLNGTAVSSRPLIAILENFQNADGSVDIPKVLQPFAGGLTKICRQ